MSVRLAQGSSAEHVDLDLPVGALMAWSTDTPPPGWLICIGQQLPITTYLALYNVLTGNATVFPYGANTDGAGGAGSTHFRLPDLRDRLLRQPAAGGANNTAQVTGTGWQNIGGTGGSANHTHTFPLSNLTGGYTVDGSHNHNAFLGTMNNAGANHAHSMNENTGPPNTAAANLKRAASTTYNASGALAAHSHNVNWTTTGSGDHAHSFGVNDANNAVAAAIHVHSVQIASSDVTTAPVTSLPAHVRLHHAVYTGVSA